ncbi:MAG TPA: serine hydrolase [Thermoanaerobaculia bacterium]|nr:serine hydrolase [Thermoanaerobaculia bacterium]
MAAFARLSLALLLLLSRAASAQTTCTTDDPEIRKRIDRVVSGLLPRTATDGRFGDPAKLSDRMAFYHTPGVSIAVVNDFEVEWACGFGVREQGKPEPVTPETLFQAGSISKPIFALGAMRLVEEGKLGLDDDVNQRLATWKIPATGSWQPRVTLRQLLSHSAGLTVHGFPGYGVEERIPTVVEVLDGRPPANTPRVEVNILPGVQFRYAGGGTTVAQQLVTDILGKPFPQIMRELVLDPLDMKGSTYEQPLPPARASAAATAHPWKSRPLPGRWHIYPEMAAAGLWTTAGDLARAGIELQKSLRGDPPRLLKRETVAEMLKPQVGENMGISFFLEGKDPDVRFEHGGWDEGFVAGATFYRDRGMGVVVMINSNEGNPILDEIVSAIAREYGWPGFFPEEPGTVEGAEAAAAALVGEYETSSKLLFTVTRQGKDLLLSAGSQPPLALVPQSETSFLLRPLNSKVTFEKDAQGRGSRLTLEQAGKPTTAERRPIPGMESGSFRRYADLDVDKRDAEIITANAHAIVTAASELETWSVPPSVSEISPVPGRPHVYLVTVGEDLDRDRWGRRLVLVKVTDRPTVLDSGRLHFGTWVLKPHLVEVGMRLLVLGELGTEEPDGYVVYEVGEHDLRELGKLNLASQDLTEDDLDDPTISGTPDNTVITFQGRFVCWPDKDHQEEEEDVKPAPSPLQVVIRDKVVADGTCSFAR